MSKNKIKITKLCYTDIVCLGIFNTKKNSYCTLIADCFLCHDFESPFLQDYNGQIFSIFGVYLAQIKFRKQFLSKRLENNFLDVNMSASKDKMQLKFTDTRIFITFEK